MKLNEYLFYKKITMYKFSEMCGVSYSWIQNLKDGKSTASPELAKKIEELTGGLVKAETLINKNPKRLKYKNIEQEKHHDPDTKK